MVDGQRQLVSVSAAQRCNEHVLLEIFEQLAPKDLAVAALVCDTWLTPARSLLYRSLHVNTVTPKGVQLCSTLRSSAYIRSCIRHLAIFHPYAYNNGLLDWVALLPQRSLVSINFERMPSNAGQVPLLQYPAVCTASQITIMWPDFVIVSPQCLVTILSFPFLESFTILLRSVPLRLSTTLRLKRLSLGVVAEAQPPLLVEIFRAMESQTLERLDLLLSSLRVEHVAWLTDILRPQFPSLRHLAIRTLDHTRTAPIFDDLITSLPSLQTLTCGRGTYSTRIFPLLPSGIHSLTFGSGDNEPFPREELSDAIVRLSGISGNRLQRLVIGRHRSYPNLVYFRDISSLCSSLNISFTVDRGRISNYLTMGNSS